MRFFLSLVALVFLSLRVAAATGDILSVTVLADGKTADIVIDNETPDGDYDFGLGPNGDPTTGTPKVVFTVVSLGGTDAATISTNTRTVWGTIEQRRPYPNQADPEESLSGGDLTVRIVLSDYIYLKDKTGAANSGTNPTVSILSGFYTGTGANAATGGGFAVTNNSTAVYQDPIDAWAWPGFQLMDSTTKLRVVAFHRHGQNGRPVRVVKFTVTDGTTTNTEIVSAPTYDSSVGDAVPVVEYVTTTDLTAGLTQGATLTCNYAVYPWVGDTTEVNDTSTGPADPTPYNGPKTGICNRLGTYGVTMALVDASSGNDSTGTAYDSVVYNAGTALKFATIAGAAKAIKDYNTSIRSRGDVGGGIIELAGGNHLWMGASLGAVYGTTPGTWITIRAQSGTSSDDVFLSGVFGNTDISDRVKLENITVATTTNGAFAGCLAMWLHNCSLQATASGSAPATWGTTGQRVWITGGEIGIFSQRLRHASGAEMAFPLVRGTDMSTHTGTGIVYTVIGNKRINTITGGPSWVDRLSNTIVPPLTPIFAFNELYGYDVSSGLAVLRFGSENYSNSYGAAVVQNLIEVIKGNSGGPGNLVASEGVAGNAPWNNVIYWHNMAVGGRMQFAYNSSGLASKERAYWSVKGNYWDISGIKGDTFTGGTNGGQGIRTGNWPVMFGVGATDNVNGNVSAINSPGFDFDFFGLNSVDTDSGNAESYPQFVNRKSYIGTNGLGVGDYHVTAGSPLEGAKLSWLLPYDLAGEPRDAANNATGVYVFGTATVGNTSPSVTITSPTTGASTTSPATLVATATDAQDGNLSASIVWTSSVDGPLGTGASISAPLTVGPHTITATVTDSGSLDDDVSITLTITAPSASGTINANRVNATSVRIQ